MHRIFNIENRPIHVQYISTKRCLYPVVRPSTRILTYHGGQFAGHRRGGCGGGRVRGIAALTVIAGSGANKKGPLL